MGFLFRSAVVLLLVLPAEKSSGQSDAKTPPDVLKSWSQLIGDWNVEGRIRDVPVTGTASFEWALGKHCYLGQQRWSIGHDGRNVHLTQIGGWDADAQETLEQGFSSSGDSATVRYPATPSSEKTDVVIGTIAGINGPNSRWNGTVERIHRGPNEFTLSSTIGGQIVHSLTYTRSEDGRVDDKVTEPSLR